MQGPDYFVNLERPDSIGRSLGYLGYVLTTD